MSYNRHRLRVIARTCLFIAVLGCASCVAQQLTGKWEGAYSESRRMIVFGIDFESETKGMLQILGQQIGVTATRGDGGLEIRTGGTDPTVFFGKQEGDVITGEMRDGTTILHFRMEREPLLPHPGSRAEAWQQDLDFAQRKLLRLETSFTSQSRQQFVRSIAELRASAATLDDPHLIVRLARIIAALGNAHTRLYLLRNRTDLRGLRVRVWWFRDQLYVVRTSPERTSLLGCEVLRIGEVPVLRARQMVDDLYAGSKGWRGYMSTYTLTSPEILYGADIIPFMESIRWEFVCNGEKLSVDLKPLPLRHSTAPVESWWDLAPDAPQTMEGAKGMALPVVPLYLRHPDRPYWFEYLPDVAVLYFQYFRSSADPQHPVAQFQEELLKALADHPKAALIVDLRFNTGGNGDVGKQMMADIEAASTLRKVYVITGPQRSPPFVSLGAVEAMGQGNFRWRGGRRWPRVFRGGWQYPTSQFKADHSLRERQALLFGREYDALVRMFQRTSG